MTFNSAPVHACAAVLAPHGIRVEMIRDDAPRYQHVHGAHAPSLRVTVAGMARLLTLTAVRELAAAYVAADRAFR